MNYFKLHRKSDNSELIVDPNGVIGFVQDDRTYVVTILTMDGPVKVIEPLYQIDILWEKAVNGESNK